jgi:hypothetical protein
MVRLQSSNASSYAQGWSSAPSPPAAAASLGIAGGRLRVERLGLVTVGIIAVFALVLLSSRMSFGPDGLVVVGGDARDSRRQRLLRERLALQSVLDDVKHGRDPVLDIVVDGEPSSEATQPDKVVDERSGDHHRKLGNHVDSSAALNPGDSSPSKRRQRGQRPDDVILREPGHEVPLRIPKAAAADDHIAAAAEGALSTKQTKLVHNWKNPHLDEVTGPNIRTLPANGSYVCEFFLFGMPHICRLEQGDESMLDCIHRIGGENLERALPTRCTKTPYWRSVRHLGPRDPQDISRDWVFLAQTTSPDAGPQPYIPPKDRTFRRDIESKQCSYTTLHPITFAIPFRNIVPKVTRHKFFDFLPYGMRKFPPWEFRPGDYRMGHQDEFLTSLLHKHSYYAFTHKRGGWDCMRHTEILAAGSIPYFADLHLCGKYCLVMLPKDLLKEVFDMPGVSFIGALNHPNGPPNREFIEPIPRATANMNYNKPGRIDWNTFDEKRYYELADKMLEYTQKYMSTRSLVAYVLHKIGYDEPRHALVMGRDHMDYMELMMESGFADLGINYTTHLQRPTWHQVVEPESGAHLTVEELENQRTARGLKSEMHGASMVVGLRIPPLQNPTDHDDIRRKLKEGFFDLVVYTWPHWPVGAGYPFWPEVHASLPKERIVFVDGGDDGDDPHNDFRPASRFGHIFRRELHEGSC